MIDGLEHLLVIELTPFVLVELVEESVHVSIARPKAERLERAAELLGTDRTRRILVPYLEERPEPLAIVHDHLPEVVEVEMLNASPRRLTSGWATL